jgi:hypothetical protein
MVDEGQWAGDRTFAVGPGAEKLKSDLESRAKVT